MLACCKILEQHSSLARGALAGCRGPAQFPFGRGGGVGEVEGGGAVPLLIVVQVSGWLFLSHPP